MNGKKEHRDLNDDEIHKVVENVLQDIHERRANKGSIPDAWVFIKNDVSTYLFIIENKLYNLDPDQINNHIEKKFISIK